MKYHSSQVKESLLQNNSGAQRIQKLVNEDKCNYSKLLSYELQDIEFIQEFMVRANNVSNSELMKIPGDSAGGDSRSIRVTQGIDKPKRNKSKNHLKSTQSLTQKGKDESKIPTIQPSRPKGAKPPIQLKPIVKLPKSSSASNMRSNISGNTLTAVEEEPERR